MTPLREHRKVTVKVECRSRSQHVTWGRMNEKVQVAFSSAHYYAPTPILHSIHLSWHLGTFILFVGLSWSILFLSHICTRIWIFHIIIFFFFVLIFASFLNCSIQNFCVCGVFWSASFVFLSVMLGEGRVLITNKSLTVSDIQLVINSHNYGYYSEQT